MNSVLAKLEASLAASLKGLDAQQTQYCPKHHPEKWSIQQIVEHLLLTYVSTRGAIQNRVDKGKPTDARATGRQRLMQLVLIRCGIFPDGRASPAAVAPGPVTQPLSGLELAASVHAELAALDPIFCKAEELFGGQSAITH